MHSSIFYSAALLSLVSAHGVILKAVGDKGMSVGFQVDPNIARNCTGISPCQQDTTIIRDAEINANIVNECGRTELTGNIDVGENTENAIAAGQITSVKAGGEMTVTIHQVNADGAGPYVCDLDQTGNAGIISQNLTVTNNIPGVNGFSQAKTQNFDIKIKMPDNLACTGASTGNVCTVRCRNNALAGPFGGCFAVQQSGKAANKQANSANQIDTAQTLSGINAQIAQNNADLPVAIAANQQQGTPEGLKAVAAAQALAGLSVTSIASPVQTPARANIGKNAAAAVESGTGKAGASAAAPANAAPSKSAGKGAKAAATGAASAAATGKAAKGAKNNAVATEEKRSALKWAKRAMGEQS